MANPISKKLKYINKNGEEKEITLYDNPASFSDYDGGNYIAVQADESTVGYIYCNSELPKDTTTHFASFIDKNNNLRYAYIEELTQSQSPSITYTFKTGYDVMPKINGVIYSSKYEDTINGDGTTTRTLLIDEPITQISFFGITNNSYLLSFDECYGVKLTTCSGMFSGCKGLTSINLSNFDTSNVTAMGSMFYNCTSLTSINLSNFDTSNVTAMGYMFYNCKGLTSIDIRSFSSINLSNCSLMLTSVPSTCKVYVNKNKFTKTASNCGFKGSFTYV